ncbi:ROK family transcriptional regulator [Actinopolymorpha alba]|uniref:ROK family transcriptional regulator n=1 Tax=Actinopolymorpha alba TaxID=533267 RepID=UPI000366ECCC|nr:ROK family transcriptional regulator [Actinopolymorpha alba]
MRPGWGYADTKGSGDAKGNGGANSYAGANHQSVKHRNRALIFRAIHALGPIARVDLAQQTGLNPATVSHIVEDLLAGGLARETGYRSSSRAGRRPVSLEINPAARYAIGVDLARNAITAAVVDLSGRVRERLVESADSPWRGDLALPTAGRMVEELLSQLTAAERAALIGIGIGAPGPVSIRSGRYLAPRSFHAWYDLDLVKDLQDRLRLPAYVDNNANTSALAELWFGAGQGTDNFVLLNIGTGVGTGLVLDGDLYRGNHDLAGEAGHLSVNLDGPRCRCGNSGCLEMYVAVPRVLAALRAARGGLDGDVTIEQAISALRQGDPLTHRVFAEVARHLAAGIVTIIYTLDPQLILLGRELSTAGEALLAPVRAEVRRRVFPALRDAVTIEQATLPDAPVIGAATLALREFFQAPLDQPTALPH